MWCSILSHQGLDLSTASICPLAGLGPAHPRAQYMMYNFRSIKIAYLTKGSIFISFVGTDEKVYLIPYISKSTRVRSRTTEAINVSTFS